MFSDLFLRNHNLNTFKLRSIISFARINRGGSPHLRERCSCLSVLSALSGRAAPSVAPPRPPSPADCHWPADQY